MKLFIKPWIAILLATALLIPVGITAKEKSVSTESRNAAAMAKLQTEANITSVYTKGACCPSCAIGIRIKISKLDFVDRKRFSKGVKLDSKHELVHIAIKPDYPADVTAIAKAITDAGYDPVYAYSLADNKLVTTSLSNR